MAIKCRKSLVYNRKLMLITLFKNFLCEVEDKAPRYSYCIKDKKNIENHRNQSKM